MSNGDKKIKIHRHSAENIKNAKGKYFKLN